MVETLKAHQPLSSNQIRPQHFQGTRSWKFHTSIPTYLRTTKLLLPAIAFFSPSREKTKDASTVEPRHPVVRCLFASCPDLVESVFPLFLNWASRILVNFVAATRPCNPTTPRPCFVPCYCPTATSCILRVRSGNGSLAAIRSAARPSDRSHHQRRLVRRGIAAMALQSAARREIPSRR